MSLDFQTIDVRFTEGLDTKTEKKLVIPSKWNKLENCTLSENDTPQRRDGITALVGTANGNGLATYNKELLVVSGSSVKSVSTGGVDQALAVSGLIGNVGVAKQEIRRSIGMQDSCDVASGGGYTCYVWADMNGSATQTSLRCSLFDETTGTQLISNAQLISSALAFCPRVVFVRFAAIGDAFFIFYNDGIDDLFCRVILVSAPTVLGAQTSLISSVNLAGLAFDVCEMPGGEEAVVAYAWTDGVTSVRALSVFHAGAVPVIQFGPTNLITQAQLPVANVCGLACAPLATAGLVGVFSWGFGVTAMAGIAGVTLDVLTTVVTPATQLVATGPAVNAQCHITATAFGGNFEVFADNQSSWSTAALTPLRHVTASSTLVPSGAGTIISSASFNGTGTDPSGPSGPWIAGKAFATSAALFVPVCVMENWQGLAATTANDNEQNVLFVLQVASGVGTVVAKALYGSYGLAAVNSNPPRVVTPCSTPEVSSGVFALACTERTLLSVANGFNVSSTGVVRLTLTPNTTLAPIRAQLGESTYWAGGSLAAYDGKEVTELGFPLFPEGINVEVVVGGGAMTAGVHQVVVIAEWVDNAGQRHQSAPSPAVSATVAANGRLRVRVPSLLLSQKTDVLLVAYVTQAGGTTFNRVATASTGIGGTANDTSLAFTTLALIDAADSAYAGNQLLYTQPNDAGTPLPNVAPGPMNVLAVHQNRLFFDIADQPGQFGYSQQYVNNVGLQFNPELGGTVSVAGGSIVGFETMDEKLILFCTNKPFVVYGSGPDAAGGSSSYGTPQEVSSDVGCSDARSILKMPQGIIFKSAKGWYMLGRDLQVRYIGDGVAEFDANPVSSAVLLADRQECRFASSSGTQLIYSYDTNGGQWSTTVYRAYASFSATPVAVADAVWWTTGGYYASVSLTNGLNQDTPGVFLDQPGTSLAALQIPTTSRTAWLRMAIINGFQRVRWMYLTGTSPTAPTSTLTVSVDFDDAYGLVAPGSYQFTVPFATVFPAFVAGTSVDFRHKLIRQKCKSVAFTFVDTPTTANPAGVNFQALSLELGLKKGLKKLPAAQSV